MLRLAVGENFLDGHDSSWVAGGTDSISDEGHLTLDVVVVTLFVLQGRQYRDGLVSPSVRQEPTRRFGQSQHHDNNADGEDALEGDGETPDKCVWPVSAAVVDPVGEHGADSHVATLNADELAAVVCRAALSLVRRDSRGIDAIAHAGNESSYDKLGRRADRWGYGGDLNDNTNNHDGRSQEDALSPAEIISEGQNEEGADETAHRVDGCDEALPGAVALDLGEVGHEGGG